MSKKKYTDKELADMAWDLIKNLKTCPAGHIISHQDVVDCMVKYGKKIQEK